MSASLAKDLRAKYGVRALPVHKGDEVKVVRGFTKLKGREGKVTTVYRKKFVLHVDRVNRDKKNGQVAPIPIHPSNVIITKLNLEREVAKDRKALIARKAAGRAGDKDKMADVD